METIFAPWRKAYIRGERPQGCVLCRDSLRTDELIACEGKDAFVMVNRYPYTGGHLMVVTARHLSRIEDILPEERQEIFALVDLSVRVLTEAMQPQGFNIGMNLGKAGGAGIDDHLHIHVVPRWLGDTNFVSVIGGVRVIPEDVNGTCALLKPYFERLKREICG
jgi:ATP adenylyltransferase